MTELVLTPCQVGVACTFGAGCGNHAQHPDDWFEDPGSGRFTPEGRRRRKAMDACWNDCPIRARLVCLDLGLREENQFHGIWGGYTEAQRQEISELREARRKERMEAREAVQ